MPFKILNIIIIFFSLTIYSYSAGTSGGKTNSNFDLNYNLNDSDKT